MMAGQLKAPQQLAEQELCGQSYTAKSSDILIAHTSRLGYYWYMKCIIYLLLNRIS